MGSPRIHISGRCRALFSRNWDLADNRALGGNCVSHWGLFEGEASRKGQCGPRGPNQVSSPQGRRAPSVPAGFFSPKFRPPRPLTPTCKNSQVVSNPV